MRETVMRLQTLLMIMAMLVICAGGAAAEPAIIHQQLQAKPAAKDTPLRNSYIGAAQETYQLFVFGDSLAAGLFSGMSRMAEGDLRIAIDGRFKDDSGLARPEFYDWAAALPKIHERRKIDIAVILLGSNDGQDIRTISGPIGFSTPEWASTYAQRVDEIISRLKNMGIAIYWVELPPMGPAPLEAEAGYVATIQRDRAVREKIRYVETRKVFNDSNGRYTDQGADPTGRITRLRSRDGIHFLKSGNNKLAMLVLEAIRRDIEIADGKVTRVFVSPHADDPVRASPQKEIRPMPIFGQTAGSREELSLTLITADPRWASAVLAVKGGAGQRKGDALSTPQTIVSALKARVAPQSSAGLLLFEGRWPKSRKGRYDDFSWPKQE
jgi:hypothetical protein